MQTKFTIIGAGIVGLSTAFNLLKLNPELRITILEKEDGIAKHQTGNNSGVIHSGIYYKPGSLKAKNCRTGYKMLLDFCDKLDVDYEICGKVIVATNNDELQYLSVLNDRAIANGLKNIKRISQGELLEIEPNVNGIEALFVGETGIIDYKKVCKKIEQQINNYDCRIIFKNEVKSIKVGAEECVVTTNKGEYTSDQIISCAGLHSDRMASLTQNNFNMKIIPFRGEYYKLKVEKRNLVKNLIYPVPNPKFPFLGVHFTRMIDGEVEAGPNAVLAFKREGYKKSDFNLSDTYETFTHKGFLKVMGKYWSTGLGEFYRSYSKSAFVKALQKLIPNISKADLEPGGAGIRAQACDMNGNLIDDFYFVQSKNILHVCNAPSPAATSSFAIGEHIAKKVLNK